MAITVSLFVHQWAEFKAHWTHNRSTPLLCCFEKWKEIFKNIWTAKATKIQENIVDQGTDRETTSPACAELTMAFNSSSDCGTVHWCRIILNITVIIIDVADFIVTIRSTCYSHGFYVHIAAIAVHLWRCEHLPHNVQILSHQNWQHKNVTKWKKETH